MAIELKKILNAFLRIIKIPFNIAFPPIASIFSLLSAGDDVLFANRYEVNKKILNKNFYVKVSLFSGLTSFAAIVIEVLPFMGPPILQNL